jgi:acetyltransferase-like isoleucine patch superfamily enzyme
MSSQISRRIPDRISVPRRIILYFRNLMLEVRASYLRRLGMDIGADTQISLKAHLDRTNPRGIHIGRGTLVAFGAAILSHDLARVLHTDTYVGENCFIGARSIILPGVRVGDGSIVAAGSVVTMDIPPGCIVGGNPARILKSGIKTRKWGILEESYRTALQFNNEHSS